MYDPVKDGVAKTVESVVYSEAPPPAPLGELVHCFWELRVSGHEILPVGGHETARWWPTELPTGGRWVGPR